jgi:transglycosylase-like protein
MARLRRSARVTLGGLAAALVLAVPAGLLLRPRLERAVRARIEREAARRGVSVEVQAVEVGLWPPLRLQAVRLEKPGAGWVTAETVDLSLRAWGSGLAGRTRLGLGPLVLGGPAGLTLEAAPTSWDVSALSGDGLRLELRRPARGLRLDWLPGAAGDRLEATAIDLPAGRIVTPRRDGLPLLDVGTLSGTVRLTRAPDRAELALDLRGLGMRLASLSQAFPVGEAYGQPTDARLSLAGSWRRAESVFSVPEWRLALEGATLSGSTEVSDVGRDPNVDLALEVERVDFARLFRTSGLLEPDAVPAAVQGASRQGDLGSATLSLRVKGQLSQPDSFRVWQRLDFRPPRRMPAAIDRLRGDFVHEAELPGGGRQLIDVSASSPDFVALDDVPPLFLRTLLLGEDSGFYGHRGVDLAELPSAVLTNLSRGSAARGASTITQQLAKNLFLSRDKRLGRKLQELSLALLLESALGKRRILEIYVNVIEWGPGLYGLRPAAQRYFHAEPRALTPAQMAFLVALIPGPLKYQSSFARGTVSPGFRPLVNGLLAKLRSVDALSEEQYQAALADPLFVSTADSADPGAGGLVN